MFFTFKQNLIKMGKFRINFGVRLKGVWALVAYMFYAMFYLMWYSVLASLWLMYGVIWIIALPIKGIKKRVDSGEWEKTKVLKVCGIVFASMFIIGLIGNLTRSPKRITSNEAINDTVVTASTNNVTQSTTSTTAEADIPNEYAEDDTVNRFITEYNDLSAYPMTDISQGNIRIKYHCTANDCWIEIINGTKEYSDILSVSIDGGNKDSGEEKMFKVFADVVKVLDASLTDERIENFVKELEEGGGNMQSYSLGDKIAITYVPSAEMSWGRSNRRIDVSASYCE